jgi:hypothetical protein
MPGKVEPSPLQKAKDYGDGTHRVECFGLWTKWTRIGFSGGSHIEALEKAYVAFSEATIPIVVPGSYVDGDLPKEPVVVDENDQPADVIRATVINGVTQSQPPSLVVDENDPPFHGALTVADPVIPASHAGGDDDPPLTEAAVVAELPDKTEYAKSFTPVPGTKFPAKVRNLGPKHDAAVEAAKAGEKPPTE